MRRPKQPGQAGKRGEQEESPPGGRARKRLEQFNRQRGLLTSLPSSGERDAGTGKPSLKKKSMKK